MPVLHRLSQREGDASTDANKRRLLDAELGRDLLGSAEADAADAASQTVRVLRDQLNSMISRITFCSAQPAMIRSARLGPIPVTSRRRPGYTASAKARTSFFA
jgi:hypothetical protein